MFEVSLAPLHEMPPSFIPLLWRKRGVGIKAVFIEVRFLLNDRLYTRKPTLFEPTEETAIGSQLLVNAAVLDALVLLVGSGDMPRRDIYAPLAVVLQPISGKVPNELEALVLAIEGENLRKDEFVVAKGNLFYFAVFPSHFRLSEIVRKHLGKGRS